MSVNLVYAMNPEKVRKFGKYFGSIDFETTYAGKASIDRLGKTVQIGTLFIDNRTYRLNLEQIDQLIAETSFSGEFVIFGDRWELTRAETERVVETLKAGRHVFFQKYRLGL